MKNILKNNYLQNLVIFSKREILIFFLNILSRYKKYVSNMVLKMNWFVMIIYPFLLQSILIFSLLF
jgi:hypothetical protein